MSPTHTQQGPHEGLIKRPLSPQRTETVGDSRVRWGWAVQTLSSYQGFYTRIPFPWTWPS